MVVCVLSLFSHVWLFSTLGTVVFHAPLSMGFSRQEYWSGLPCPPPGDLPSPGTEPTSLLSPALVGRFFTSSATWEASVNCNSQMKRHKAWRQTFRRKKKWKLKFLEASKTLASVVIFYFQSGYLYQVLLVPGKWHIAILQLTNCNIRRTVCFQKTVEMMPCLGNPIYNFD